MGGAFSSIFHRFYGKKEIKLVMIGLDYGGKTTILYQLKMGEVVQTIPTIGFNVETVNYENISFSMWDICSGDKIRPLWRHYFYSTHGVIFVVDSADRERMTEAAGELRWIAPLEELKDTVFLIFANKQDLPNAMTVAEIVAQMELSRLLKNKRWYIQPASAVNGQGLYEGLDWLSRQPTYKY